MDAQALFAELAERERVHGHHSAEGQAIRLLSRALQGWSLGQLAGADVLSLGAQAMEDWLKRRLRRSPWSADGLAELASAAATGLTPGEVESLKQLAALRQRGGELAPSEIEKIIAAAIAMVERRWS